MFFAMFPAEPIIVVLHHEVILGLGFPVYFVGWSTKETMPIYGTTVELLKCHRFTSVILYRLSI